MRSIRPALLALAVVLICMTAAFAAGETKKQKLTPEDEKKYELAFEAALAHFEKANLLYKKAKTEETIKELNAIVGIVFPEGTEDRDGLKIQLDASSFLGELLLEKKQPDKALEVLKSGLKKAPEVSQQTYQLYMTIGHVYKEMKKTDDALAAFEKAQKINDILRKQKEAEEKAAKKKEAGK